MRRVKRSLVAAALCATGLGVLTVTSSGAQVPTPTIVRAGGAVITTGQPGVTPTVRAVGVVAVTGTPAPRAGAVPLEIVPALVAAGAGAVGLGALVLRRGRKSDPDRDDS